MSSAVLPALNRAVDPASAMLEALEQLAGVLVGLDLAEHYLARPSLARGATLGAHVRHCLDHVHALLAGLEGRTIDYEARRRGAACERCPQAALDELVDLGERLTPLVGQGGLERFEVQVATQLSADAEPLLVPSNLARELAYGVAHTVHHNAIMALMLRELGGDPPAEFGLAPGTIVYRRQQRPN